MDVDSIQQLEQCGTASITCSEIISKSGVSYEGRDLTGQCAAAVECCDLETSCRSSVRRGSAGTGTLAGNGRSSRGSQDFAK